MNSEVMGVLVGAIVLAKPVIRAVLMMGGVPSGFRVGWSLVAEREAVVLMRPRVLTPALVR